VGVEVAGGGGARPLVQRRFAVSPDCGGWRAQNHRRRRAVLGMAPTLPQRGWQRQELGRGPTHLRLGGGEGRGGLGLGALQLPGSQRGRLFGHRRVGRRAAEQGALEPAPTHSCAPHLTGTDWPSAAVQLASRPADSMLRRMARSAALSCSSPPLRACPNGGISDDSDDK